jgi:hypothetical protein
VLNLTSDVVDCGVTGVADARCARRWFVGVITLPEKGISHIERSGWVENTGRVSAVDLVGNVVTTRVRVGALHREAPTAGRGARHVSLTKLNPEESRQSRFRGALAWCTRQNWEPLNSGKGVCTDCEVFAWPTTRAVGVQE